MRSFLGSFVGAPTEEQFANLSYLDLAHAGGPKPTFVHRIAIAYPIYKHPIFYQLN